MTIYKNRQEAGRQLALSLQNYKVNQPVILAMPRGGVVVAYEVANILDAPLDIIVARKLGAPDQPEYAIGAIAPGNILVKNNEASYYWESNTQNLKDIIKNENEEMQRRIKLYRGKNATLSLREKVVIIIDDGVATGQSAIAAIRSVRKQNPLKIIFAVPVGAKDSITKINKEVDEVICLSTPEPFIAVGIWYSDFKQTSDDEVISLLEKNRALLKAKLIA